MNTPRADLETVCRLIDAEELVSFLQELIRIPSVGGNEGPVAELVAARLRYAGLVPEVQDVLPGRPNVMVRLPGSGGGPTLLLDSHMDTVSPGSDDTWTDPPFSGVVREGRVYGRGASDDKGGVAAMTIATAALATASVRLRGDLVFAAVMGEVGGNLGTRRLIQSGLRPDSAIVGEYSHADRVAIGYRGLAWGRVTVRGRGAHPGRPHLGINAINKMIETVLPALKALPFEFQPNPLFPNPGVTVGMIEGGSAINVIPDRCMATLDIRIVPGQRAADVVNQVEGLLAELRSRDQELMVSVDWLHTGDPFLLEEQNQLVAAVRSCITDLTGEPAAVMGKTGFSDANVIVGDLGVPALAYGPGNPSGHGPDEYVDISALELAAKVYAAVAVRLLG